MPNLTFQGTISSIALSSPEDDSTLVTFKFSTVMRTPAHYNTLGAVGKLTGHTVKLTITNDQLELDLQDEPEGAFADPEN